MVRKAFLMAAILALTVTTLSVGLVSAQDRVYSFDHEWAQIFINQDGTIDLTYNVTTCGLGSPKAISQGAKQWISMGINWRQVTAAAEATIKCK